MTVMRVMLTVRSFPERVGRVVIDGVVDADAWSSEYTLRSLPYNLKVLIDFVQTLLRTHGTAHG